MVQLALLIKGCADDAQRGVEDRQHCVAVLLLLRRLRRAVGVRQLLSLATGRVEHRDPEGVGPPHPPRRQPTSDLTNQASQHPGPGLLTPPVLAGELGHPEGLLEGQGSHRHIKLPPLVTAGMPAQHRRTEIILSHVRPPNPGSWATAPSPGPIRTTFQQRR
jgi:hypothetical protein